MIKGNKADCIICLGNVLTSLGKLDMSARVKKAVQLWKAKKASFIVFSGGRTANTDESEAAYMKQLAKKKGVPESAMFCEEKSTSTVENALFCQNLVKEKNWNSLLVVSTEYHTKRVAFIFKSILLDKNITVVGAPSPLLPQQLLWAYIKEAVKLLFLRIKGIKEFR